MTPKPPLLPCDIFEKALRLLKNHAWASEDEIIALSNDYYKAEDAARRAPAVGNEAALREAVLCPNHPCGETHLEKLPPSPPLEEVRQEGWREAQRWLVEIFELNAARKMEMMLKERETAALRSRTATPDAGRD